MTSNDERHPSIPARPKPTAAPPSRRGRSAAVALLAAAAAVASPAASRGEGGPSEQALAVARYAVEEYADDTLATLAELVAFPTVHQPGLENEDNPVFRDLVDYLREKARAFGFDFTDYGGILVIGLGDSGDRLGVVTHADVQPADPAKWARDPFSLDAVSEPGKLVGRGTEDDKGPLSAALYAMKALAERAGALDRRIELIVSLTEESDWAPFRAALEIYSPPPLNVAFDARYPVVVAEKGWGEIHLAVTGPAAPAGGERPYLASFSGGAFLSQVPEEVEAVVRFPSPELEREIEDAIRGLPEGFRVTVRRDGDALILSARGRSAHSMEPEKGLNAIAHLADFLSLYPWPDSRASRMVRLINDRVGPGDHAERFGDLAHSHPFMGRLTLTLATVRLEGEELVAGLSFRRPVGRTQAQIEEAITAAVDSWKAATGIDGLRARFEVTDPYYLEDAPHVPVLLEVFRHFTGLQDAQPISIGGGSNARLVPRGVNFGPSMPGETYTGHSEHEFIRREQLLLNLEMYTAALYELAARRDQGRGTVGLRPGQAQEPPGLLPGSS